MEKRKLHLHFSIGLAFMVLFVQFAFFPLHYSTHLHNLSSSTSENLVRQAQPHYYIHNNSGIAGSLDCSLCTLFFHQTHFLESFQANEFIDVQAKQDGFYVTATYLGERVTCTSRGPPHCTSLPQL